jgi:hypothetical protein
MRPIAKMWDIARASDQTAIYLSSGIQQLPVSDGTFVCSAIEYQLSFL